MIKILKLFLLCVCFASCGTSEQPLVVNKYNEHVFVVNIAPGEQKLQEYLNYHKKVWPEVEAGFKKAGYKQISLYRFDHLVVMRILVDKGADLDQLGKLSESYSPKCKEWNKLMGAYQVGVNGTAPDQKWVETELFYEYLN
ncbi:L-rhamnose mutarotase [Pedobacter nyackensis]|uniref:L-rhamnose mutarotase n=1 Tax=Pedobacter nyackensis TaxID=475255 RepID=A0A1W2CQU1_9SPHI|nr:L-rhamnose mutarotase [Pedobacter nyackensis]SMC87324.1 L-rhamnose mutarotase [Pedobacter nyackensis]